MTREKLTAAMAGDLYRGKRWSACQIAEAYGITRGGAEARIRASGVGGLTWCPIHRTHEELTVSNAEAVSLMEARHGPPQPARRAQPGAGPGQHKQGETE